MQTLLTPSYATSFLCPRVKCKKKSTMRTRLNFKVFFLAFISILVTSCDDMREQGDAERGMSAPIQADLIIKNARIYTSSDELPWAEAFAVRNGKFIFVGDIKGIEIYQGAMTVDLHGRLVIPGMFDGHAHPGYVNIEKFGEVAGHNIDELLKSVRAYADRHPDEKWLRLCCWPASVFPHSSQGPHKAILDAVVPDRLVWFESETAHDFWLNSKALKELRIDKSTRDPKPGLAVYVRDENGEPTGWVKEGAGVQHFAKHFAVIDEAHAKRHRDSVLDILNVLSGYGVTSIFDAGNKGFGDLTYRVISQLEKEGRLPLRYQGTYQIFIPERVKSAIPEIKRYRKEFGGELLTFNTVKLFMDGITANRSAAYSKPYKGGTSVLGPMLSVDQLRDLLLELHNEKLDLHVHSIGDLAVRTVLDAVEAAKEIITKDFYPRVTVAHLALIDPADLGRLKSLGVIANFTPWWFGSTQNDPISEILGSERYSNMYRAKAVANSGAIYTFSSDEWWGGDMLPTYINPYVGMQVGHTRQYPIDWWETEDDGIKAPLDQRLSLEELLIGYTRNGAYQLRMEDRLGSIEEGKIADFVVLEKNLFDIDPYEISKVKPLAVFLEGRLLQGGSELMPPSE